SPATAAAPCATSPRCSPRRSVRDRRDSARSGVRAEPSLRSRLAPVSPIHFAGRAAATVEHVTAARTGRGLMRGFRTTIAAVACCAAALAGAASRTAAATWTDKVTTTPSLVQTNFGRFGDRLPLNGEISCGETAIAMSLLWLGENGFTQLAPAKPTREDGLQLIRIFTGMAEAPTGGSLVDEDWYRYAVTTYLGLKGVGENQYHWERQIGPSVAWLEEHNQNQSFVNFAVGWYVPDANEPGVWDRTGQHWLTLLATDPEAGTLTINNPYPAAFFAVPNLPSQNPQAIPTIPFTAGT